MIHTLASRIAVACCISTTPTMSQAPVTSGVYDITAPGEWNFDDKGTSDPSDDEHLVAIPNDGLDDRAAIAHVIAYANATGGGTVYVPSGDYHLSSGITLPPGSPLSLVGAGVSSRLMYNTASWLNNDEALTIGDASAVSQSWKIQVRDLYIITTSINMGQGNAGSQVGRGVALHYTVNCKLENIRIEGFAHGLNILNKSSGNYLRDVFIAGCSATGLRITGGENQTSDSWLTDNRYWSVRVVGYPGTHKIPRGVLLEGDNIGDQFFYGLFCNHCVVGFSVAAAIGTTGYRTNILLDDYTSDWCSSWAIEARDMSNIRLSGAFVGVRGIALIRCDDSSVSHSWFSGDSTEDTFRDAINLTDSDRVIVDGNTIKSFGRGVNVINSAHTTITGNRLSRFNHDSSGSAKGQAIRLTGAGSSDAMVANNLIDASSGDTIAYGIIEESGQGTTGGYFSFNRILGNVTVPVSVSATAEVAP